MSEPWRPFASLLAALLIWSVAAPAQDVQEPDPLRDPVEITAAAVEARLARIREIQGIAEDLRTSVAESYTRALERIREGDAAATASAAYAASIETAAQELVDLRARLAAIGDAEPSPQRATLSELEQLVATARATLQQAQTDIQSADRDAARRTERRAAIPTRLPEAQRELDEVIRQLQAPPTAGEHPYLTAARTTRLLALRRSLELELESLGREQAFYEATPELIGARRDLAARQAAVSGAQVDALQTRVQELRLAEATRAEAIAQQTAREAQGDHPFLATLARENADLAQRRTTIASSLEKAEAEKKATEDRLAEQKRDFENIKARVTEVGLTEAIGVLLRQRRSRIPVSGRELRSRLERLGEDLADIRLQIFDLEDEQRSLVDLPTWVQARFDDDQIPEADRDALRQPALDLLESRRSIVTDLLKDGKGYQEDLAYIDGTLRQTIRTDAEYRDYINEHVLWIRSSSPLWKMDWQALVEAGGWLVDPRNWYAAGTVVLEAAVLDPGRLLLLLLGLALLASRSRLRRNLAGEGALAAKRSTTTYWPTARALVYTILVTLPVPILFWTIGHALEGDPDPTESFSRDLGAGLDRSGWILLGLELLRQILRAGGLGEAHFLWRAHALSALRKNLSWLIWTVVPIGCVVAMFASRDHGPWSGSLGRTALCAGLIALIWFLFPVLHPRRGILAEFNPASGWIVRMRGLWFLLGVGTPAALLLLALLGYGFTALQLVQRLETTFGMLLLAFLTQALIVRALFLTHRKLAMEQARERRRAAKEAQETPADMPEIPLPEEPEIDPSKIALQTRHLLRMAFGFLVLLGAWQIWVDVLPALGMFRQYVVWTDANTVPQTQVTLANLLFAVLIAFVTFLAARNLPGFLELVLLRRLPIQQGERHAITTLVAYSAIGIGVISSFSVIGIGWSKVQWLIAAMSVGLGFGLQEVFANFVSGVILLFERPIRVGDVVTVGDTMARVSKMQIRATTLVDWDRKELVVPNKEFVTSRFTNWTLSDPITRVTFPVGIAYGSNTALAQEKLLAVAKASPLVLEEPRPRAIFRRFGDSSLDFELRLFIKNIDELPQVMNEINTGIDNAFREAGIEIAFPQRDLHLRTAPAIVEYLGRPKSEEARPFASD